MSTTSTNIKPSVAGPGEGEAYWFFGTLTTIKGSSESTGGRVAVTENLAPRGAGSPLHIHTNEDEWFYVIDGELTLWVDELGEVEAVACDCGHGFVTVRIEGFEPVLAVV